jgi:biopolymer transport protein TolQ
MTGELSVLDLVRAASLPVQLVLVLLVAASVLSWAIVFRKQRLVREARAEADRFEGSFWSGGDLAALYRTIEGRATATGGIESLFAAGFRDFTRLRGQAGQTPESVLDGARRAMRIAQLKEIDRLEHSLATLATIGSTSPYVGLFGTVWGIMVAFHGLGNVKQATIAMVAPGIAEALIATAIGLFAAIPAVIAYNRFADQVSRLELRYDTFIEEFSSILQRHAAARSG